MSLTNPLPRATRQTPVYVADGVTATYPFPFYFLSALDLVVDIRIAGAAPQTLSGAVGYSATGVGATGGGYVTLTAIPAAGARVQISGRRIASRVVNVTTDGVVRAKPLEAELDAITLTAQELRRDIDETRALIDGLLSAAALDETSRAGGLFALRGHTTSGVNWLDAVADAVPPDEGDPFNIAFEDPSWRASSVVWVYIYATLGAALPGGFTGAQLAALQAEAATLSPARGALAAIRRSQALLALKASSSAGFPDWLTPVQDAVAAAEDAETSIYFHDGYWPVGGVMWATVAALLSLSTAELAALQARALAIP